VLGKPGHRGFTVLLIGHDAATRAKIADAVPADYELVTVQGGEAGVRASRLCGPDVILFDLSVCELETLEALGADPLSRSVPFVVLVGEDQTIDEERWPRTVVAERVRKPVNVVELRGLIAAIVEGVPRGERLLKGDLGEASVSDVVEFVQRELEHWVLEAAGPGATKVRIKLGSSGELMGALWSFVSRLREVIGRGSDGAVTFRALEDGRISMLSLSAASENVDEADIVGEEVAARGIESLRGLRAVVADDDAGVRDYFSAVLQEVGMEVDVFANGREALASIRGRRPDIVITDIVMPEMDGWELLRALRHDVLLQDVSVVVLSWKDDFLQRLRELEAGADEYMKKELDRTQILLKISNVLSARFNIESQLASEPTFSGRVEAVGIVPLLLALSRTDGRRKLVVREAWNLFELEFDHGRLLDVAVTTTKRHTIGGRDALAILLGTRRGRFTVEPSEGVASPSLDGELANLFIEAAAPVQELVSKVDRGAIIRVARVKLRTERLGEYIELAPAEVRQVIARLVDGESPRDLILSGQFSPQELERVVLDLVRRGIIDRIEAPDPTASLAPATGDEERWAILRGKLSTPSTLSARDGGSPIPIPALQSSKPVTVSPPSTAAPAPGRTSGPWPRIVIYLLIIAAVVIGLKLLGGPSSGTDPAPPVVPAPADVDAGPTR
jgi:CheY-like chemotaxis protein